jgi:hypothetical protein
MNLLKHPVSQNFGQYYPIVQYANDTLIILPVDVVRLLTLKGLLRSFADSTWLRVNYSKSFMVAFNVDEGKALHLA